MRLTSADSLADREAMEFFTASVGMASTLRVKKRNRLKSMTLDMVVNRCSGVSGRADLTIGRPVERRGAVARGAPMLPWRSRMGNPGDSFESSKGGVIMT